MDNVIFDYSKLKDKIQTTSYINNDGDTELYNLTSFAKAIGISYYSLYKKLRNIVPFTQQEIINCVRVLGIEPSEISIYFFTEKVEKTQF